MAVATPAAEGWTVAAPRQVGTTGPLRERLHLPSEGHVVVGFDFPIGLPAAYAAAVGVTSFRDFLGGLGRPPWDRFGAVAESPDDISLHRPFYPRVPGGASRAHQSERLGLTPAELVRPCDLAPGRRPAPLFWTLGANQVGKGALAGWELLRHELDEWALWPFDGPLHELIAVGRDVVVETYPADAYGAAGFVRGSKRAQHDRAAAAATIVAAFAATRTRLTPELVADVDDGFGADAWAEDRFDAVLGLLRLLQVVVGIVADGTPYGPPTTTVEGWIVGRETAARDR